MRASRPAFVCRLVSLADEDRPLPKLRFEEATMETRLILVRHGASHHKQDGIVGGINGCKGLTDLGRHQAERLAERLASELSPSPIALYSSVARRAIETAEVLSSALGDLEVVGDCGLCTWHTPAYADGLPVQRFQHEHRLPGGGVYRPFEEGNESGQSHYEQA